MLSAGTRLGPYEIVGPLGAGGMGEVYRARDTKLKRDVALKILPPAFAADDDRLARFQREAELLAALNHPHIAQIYGFVDDPAGLHDKALVLELVEGPTLADRIAQGAVPLDEALPIARQIAEALEAAHEQGIVHRDLKPANIKLRADGTVKVLDFGLAKVAETSLSQVGARDGAPVQESPTLTSPVMTQAGLILGTAAYMSPEQAKGKPADKRADIWAFGVVLYEMLTGRAPFAGDSVTETIVALMTQEAEWSALPPRTPPRVRRLLRRCLDRDHRTRLRDIGEARVALTPGADADSDSANAVVPRESGWSARAIAIGLALGLLAGIGLATIWVRAVPAAEATTRMFQVAFGETIRTPVISPDGLSVAFVRDGKLVVRRLDSFDERVLQGTDGASVPFWSPDSRSVGYFAQRGLRAIAATGGASRLLTEAAFAPWGGAWCDGRVLYTRFNEGLFEVNDGGQQRNLIPLDADKTRRPMYPHCLPDGRVLFVTRTVEGGALVLLDGTQQLTLFELQTGTIEQPTFVPPDRVVFFRSEPDRGLWSIPVAPDLSRAAGPAQLLQKGAENPSASRDGMLVFLGGRQRVLQQLVTVDRSGRRIAVLGRGLPRLLTTAVSPDGTTVATSAIEDDSRNIWLHYPLTARRWQEGADQPVWAPTSDRLAYQSPDGIFVRPVSGNVAPRLVVKNDGLAPRVMAWSPDGRWLVYQAGQAPRTIWGVRLDEAGPPTRIVERGGDAALSPDGRWLAFADDDGVFVTSFPTPTKVWPVSIDGRERHPRWNPRGGELFYAGGPTVGDDPNSRRDLYVVSIDTSGDGRPGAPTRLFDSEALGLAITYTGSRSFDISPDGQHIVLRTTGEEGIGIISAIQNAANWIAKQ